MGRDVELLVDPVVERRSCGRHLCVRYQRLAHPHRVSSGKNASNRVPWRPCWRRTATGGVPELHEVEFDGPSDRHSTWPLRAVAPRQDGEGDAVRVPAAARRAQRLRARSTARTPCPSRDGQAVFRGRGRWVVPARGSRAGDEGGGIDGGARGSAARHQEYGHRATARAGGPGSRAVNALLNIMSVWSGYTLFPISFINSF